MDPGKEMGLLHLGLNNANSERKKQMIMPRLNDLLKERMPYENMMKALAKFETLEGQVLHDTVQKQQ